jgi:5-methyltetrahydrofolate--homocysteine methyltransferase
MTIKEMLSSGFIILDGAMGTQMQQRGLPVGERPETLSLTHPEIVAGIHKDYIQSGSMVVYTNTFGANDHKLSGTGFSCEEVISASVETAKAACQGTGCKVGLDMGPVGELLAPGGSLSFEEAYSLFAKQAVAGEKAGADLVAIETMTDLMEVKAAVLAVKENTSLPVFVTMTFEENRRTFAGCSIPCMALTLEGLGVDAMGINCSLGPGEILPIMEELAQWTTLPLIVKPNAGLPNLETGSYDIDPDMFARQMAPFVDLGVTVLGGCCGTSPAYIRKLKEMLAGKKPVSRDIRRRSAVCSGTRAVEIDGVRIIGERINPTGKKLMKQALREKNMDYLLSQAVSQAEAGAHILDVNVGLPEIDEPAMMVRAVREIQSVVDLPLQIDSSDPKAVEAALRVYNGKPIVNSVNGEEASLATILPLIKKYGAAVVGLTLDEKGIPPKAEDRFAIAQRILAAAQSYGIPKEDVYIDCLTLTASVQQKEVAETLKAVRMVKERLGLHTVLGVSNISFGLPDRELINHSFLLLALSHGLDLPIINPNVASMTGAVDAYNVLYNIDKNSVSYIEKHSGEGAPAASAPAPAAGETDITHAIIKGLKEPARAITQGLCEKMEPMEIVNTLLIPALDEVGNRFETGKIFLPQLLQSASAAQAAFEIIKERIASQGTGTVQKGKIVLATVKGDIHDIGKNIVKVILENYGFQVIDLGRDVPVETVVEAVQEHGARLAGLSALMTTTLPSMEATVKAIHERCPGCKVFVGGAVLTEDYALKMGADFYARDAKRSADIAKEVLQG